MVQLLKASRYVWRLIWPAPRQPRGGLNGAQPVRHAGQALSALGALLLLAAFLGDVGPLHAAKWVAVNLLVRSRGLEVVAGRAVLAGQAVGNLGTTPIARLPLT